LRLGSGASHEVGQRHCGAHLRDRFDVIRIVTQHFLELAPPIKNHRGPLAALRKRHENFSTIDHQRLKALFAK
jgi:hypothetical protein